ncbi:hypothetical protein AND_009458 [Anopheles darlingi]|uniref:Uncharacterized protein n=1 Tax=Anopheles darlingi TaxID=43151 RepID=W5J7X2_ANODA|nr:hypothetical protein AND_009458 [Anopheles darlingi]
MVLGGRMEMDKRSVCDLPERYYYGGPLVVCTTCDWKPRRGYSLQHYWGHKVSPRHSVSFRDADIDDCVAVISSIASIAKCKRN